MKKLIDYLLDNWLWDDTLFGLFTLAVICGSVIGFKALISDHQVRYYYLKGDIENGLVINADINWAGDEEIQLDRSITYEGAIEMIKDLNASLPNGTK